jgi:uncharacterized protein (TIGR03000 family)
MLHRRLLMMLAGALVTVVSPPGVCPVLGQSAGGYYYESYWHGYNPGYYARRYSAPPVFVVPSKMAPSAMPYVYYVPPVVAPPKANRAPPIMIRDVIGAGSPAPADASAQIELQVPADAQVFFDGEKTTQTGEQRQFVTPPLALGREYAYEVRATWKDSVREVTESRHLSFRAGDRVRASFPTTAQFPVGHQAANPR